MASLPKIKKKLNVKTPIRFCRHHAQTVLDLLRNNSLNVIKYLI